MSPTARVALAVVCWCLSLVAELAALALLVRESRRAGRLLRGLDGAPVDAALVGRLLANRFDRSTAVVLLGVGVIAGAVGNFLGL